MSVLCAIVTVPEALTNIDPPERTINPTDTTTDRMMETGVVPRALIHLLQRRVHVVTATDKLNGYTYMALRRRTPSQSHLYTFSRFEPQDAVSKHILVWIDADGQGVGRRA